MLISCEGTAERVIVSRLIESGRLLMPRDMLVEDPKTGEPYTTLRSSADLARKILRGYDFPSRSGEDLPVLVRVADKAVGSGRADRALSGVALPVDVITRPEIEALVVIKEGAQGAWERTSSSTSSARTMPRRRGEESGSSTCRTSSPSAASRATTAGT